MHRKMENMKLSSQLLPCEELASPSSCTSSSTSRTMHIFNLHSASERPRQARLSGLWKKKKHSSRLFFAAACCLGRAAVEGRLDAIDVPSTGGRAFAGPRLDDHDDAVSGDFDEVEQVPTSSVSSLREVLDTVDLEEQASDSVAGSFRSGVSGGGSNDENDIERSMLEFISKKPPDPSTSNKYLLRRHSIELEDDAGGASTETSASNEAEADSSRTSTTFIEAGHQDISSSTKKRSVEEDIEEQQVGQKHLQHQEHRDEDAPPHISVRDHKAKSPHSLIDLSSLAPNPYGRVQLMYCRENRFCGERSRKVKVCPSVSRGAGNREYYTLIANPLNGNRCRNPDWDVMVDFQAGTGGKGSTPSDFLYSTCSQMQVQYFEAAAVGLGKPSSDAQLINMCLWNAWHGNSAKDISLLTGRDCKDYYAQLDASTVSSDGTRNDNVCRATVTLVTAMVPQSRDTAESKHCQCEVAAEVEAFVAKQESYVAALNNTASTSGPAVVLSTLSALGTLPQVVCRASDVAALRNSLGYLACPGRIQSSSSAVEQSSSVTRTGGSTNAGSTSGVSSFASRSMNMLGGGSSNEQQANQGAGHQNQQGAKSSMAASSVPLMSAPGEAIRLSQQPPEIEFPGFQMYNVQIVRNCGIKVALFSQSFPMPADPEENQNQGPTQPSDRDMADLAAAATKGAGAKMQMEEVFADGGFSLLTSGSSSRTTGASGSGQIPSLVDAGLIPSRDPKIVAAKKQLLRKLFHRVNSLKGNVVMNSENYDIGDARGVSTKVFPTEEDESFYFVLEPQLPDHKYTFRIRYECSDTKRNALSDMYELHSSKPWAFSVQEREYVVKMVGLCENNYYWCVKEDQATGISKFYLCNNGGLTATFSLDFAYTRLQHLYAAKERETEQTPSGMCTSLYNSGYVEVDQASANQEIQVGYLQQSYFERYLGFYVSDVALVGMGFLGLILGMTAYFRRAQPVDVAMLEERKRFLVHSGAQGNVVQQHGIYTAQVGGHSIHLDHGHGSQISRSGPSGGTDQNRDTGSGTDVIESAADMDGDEEHHLLKRQDQRIDSKTGFSKRNFRQLAEFFDEEQRK
ncbi:unnamed protein product [Amoebophrya sp. A25]|nr:unnamed protein product [Amoebophrya sp. A25]|eukprot:GSA25T00005534001.1